MDNELNSEIVNKMQKRINELKREDAAIDFCLGKGVTVEKNAELGKRQNEISEELDSLKEEKKQLKNKL